MPPKRILAATLLAACAATVQAADDNKVTIENRIAQCQGCHGIQDWKTAFPEVYHVPKLGGQNAAYIVNALKEYKSGDRDFGTMRAMASDLSEDDMKQLGDYFGAKPANAANAAPEKK
ncbi:MAG TPA: cytochrome c [Usitatibacter sp.]|nr:cytochrome c [Usitatibacter sp.]